MHNFPEKLQERYRSMLKENSVERFFETQNTRLRKSIRVNTLKISVEKFKKIAKKYNWELQQVPWLTNGFYIDREDRSIPLGTTLEHQSGLFYIQEASSMIPPAVLQPTSKDVVLDMASSPGSKTTQMAESMNNKSFILANDVSSKRICGLISNIHRLGVANIAVVRKNGLFYGKKFQNTFDKVLLDAPCTGEGLIRKDPKVLESWSLKNIHMLSKLQKELIDSAFHALRNGGEMVYSTCTLAPEENEEVVNYLLTTYPGAIEVVDMKEDFKKWGLTQEQIEMSVGLTEFEGKKYHKSVEGTFRVWPHVLDCEGFYVAKLKKIKTIGTVSPVRFHKTRPDKNIKILGTKEIKRLESYLKKQFGSNVKFDKDMEFIRKNYDIYIRSPYSERFFQAVKFEDNGLHVFKDIRDELQITHLAVILWGESFRQQVIELDEKQKKDYIEGKNIIFNQTNNVGASLVGANTMKNNENPGEIPSIASDKNHIIKEGTVILKYDNVIIGKGLLRNGKIKNQYPREFRRNS